LPKWTFPKVFPNGDGLGVILHRGVKTSLPSEYHSYCARVTLGIP
jgi:hypothetical protein